jgi:hypothetical protein
LRQLNAFLSVQHSAHYCATRFEENVDLTAFSHQQPMPVIGYLGAGSPAPAASMLAIFRQALAEAGYVEGRNVAIEYRFAEGQYDRLPALAAELVRRQVAVIVAVPTPAALAAKLRLPRFRSCSPPPRIRSRWASLPTWRDRAAM